MQKPYSTMTLNERIEWAKELVADIQQRYDEATIEAVVRDDHVVIATLTDVIYLRGYERGYEHGILARQVGASGRPNPAPSAPPAPPRPEPMPIRITNLFGVLIINTVGDDAAAWIATEAPAFGKLTTSEKQPGSHTLIVRPNYDAKQVQAYLERGPVGAQTQEK